MVDWEHKDRPDVFCNVGVDDAAERLSGLFERYQPDVVITYDELGGYDHPDHVHASRVAMAAVTRTGIPRKAYFTAFRRTMFERFRAVLEEQGADLSQIPQPDPEQLRMMDAVEARITTAIEVGPFVERKRVALATHASQIDESFWGRLPTEAFGALFGEETFIRAHDTTGAPVPEADLFAGLR
jgi:LmbE family N-acetylglucosaminyl deacetylase